MLFAIIAAISGAAADVTNKILLGKLKLTLREYLPLTFIFLSASSFLLLPLGAHLDSRGLALPYMLLFIFMLFCAITWNTLLAKSMQTEPLHEYEAIILTVPFATVLLATVFLPAERNLVAILAGLVASGTLLAFKFKNHHLALSKSAKRTMLAVLFIACEAVSLKVLLDFYSPILLYFIRVTILAIYFYWRYRPDFKILQFKPARLGLILTAIFGTGIMVLKYYAFMQIGVVLTTLILLLSQVLTYVASYFYLKERRNFRPDLYCAGIIIVCIIITVIVR